MVLFNDPLCQRCLSGDCDGHEEREALLSSWRLFVVVWQRPGTDVPGRMPFTTPPDATPEEVLVFAQGIADHWESDNRRTTPLVAVVEYAPIPLRPKMPAELRVFDVVWEDKLEPKSIRVRRPARCQVEGEPNREDLARMIAIRYLGSVTRADEVRVLSVSLAQG